LVLIKFLFSFDIGCVKVFGRRNLLMVWKMLWVVLSFLDD
jgi:hypothetical protein